ncbi:TerB family tellurite resistance protein [bacterium]|nr:TerB family tellurite resistance protein [bacterium]
MDKLSPNLQLLVATAWVDNHLDPSEAILLRQILTATGIAKEEVESVLTAPPLVVGNLLDSIPNGHPREAVMRDVLRMVFSDGVLEAEEFDLLERIAQRLELDEETVDRLRQEVSDE